MGSAVRDAYEAELQAKGFHSDPAQLRAVDALQLSARSLHRILQVARTIADLAGSDAIDTPHLTEAIGYRKLERGSGNRQAA